MEEIQVPISPGELIDKLTILRIKSERIADEGKLANVKVELAALTSVASAALPKSEALSGLTEELYRINGDLWQIEDDIRDHERDKRFDNGFIGLARSVYITNDRRAAVKREINLLLGSNLVEEKSYSGDEAGK